MHWNLKKHILLILFITVSNYSYIILHNTHKKDICTDISNIYILSFKYNEIKCFIIAKNKIIKH